ncbi:MAG TPA: YgiQ family radical SAM protein [Anaeromyxobacteraceae bacterium]|nr:YgiQ family radical SAM protein [Anaeromyxobacteraceae bacterium]
MEAVPSPPPRGPPRRAAFLPTTREEMEARGFAELDVLIVTGDAYVDHPAFGAAVIGRLLEAQGLRVGVVAQPDHRSPADLARLGRPRLFVGVTAGAMDSMVNHYTAHKRRRSDDAYTPGGVAGRRPDRATAVYARLARQAFGESVPIVAGGVEASLRRLAHYDYWADAVWPSLAVSSDLDLLVYGQGERPILEIARRLSSGEDACGLVDVAGTALVPKDLALADLAGRARGVLELPSYEEVRDDRRAFARFSRLYHLEHNPENARILTQRHGLGTRSRLLVVNEPAAPLTTEELDRVHALPFAREAHPSYRGARIPALEQIRWSVQILRGCSAGCAFCSITEHQGREVTSRSSASVLGEIEALRDHPGWKGTVTDLGGPTANMWQMGCTSAEGRARCRRPSCLYPSRCPSFANDHGPLVELYRRARAIEGVKHVFVGSGVRYDLAEGDAKNGQRYLEELVAHHVSGQLKVAPEHTAPGVLHLMKKPGIEAFERFRGSFSRYTREAGKEQYLVPYFLSSHPGCTLEDAVGLYEYLRRNRWRPRQVQDFTPTPMTLSSDIYYSGYHPFTLARVEVVRDLHARRMQKALLRFADPAQRPLVEEALRRTGRLSPGARLRGPWPPLRQGGRPRPAGAAASSGRRPGERKGRQK